MHGGLRYLEQYNFSLVAESIKEKSYLLTYAPHLVHPLPFMFPVFYNDRKPLWMIYLGTWLYALLARFESTPTWFSSQKLLNKIPYLRAKGLTGGVLYQDAQTIDARLTLSSILSGLQDHAMAINHCMCLAWIEDSSKITGVHIQDGLTQKSYHVQGKWIIDATGPWQESKYKDRVAMVYSKGSHLVIQDNPFQLTSAVTMFSPEDGRVMFCIPWLGHTLVGTTDEATQETPDHVETTAKEVAYMQQTLQHYFPHQTNYTIISAFSALRTLIGSTSKNLSALKRDHQINIPKSGLVQVYGGKLTAFTKIALDVMHAIQKQDGSAFSIRHHQTFASVLDVEPLRLTAKDIETLITKEMACSVSDILIQRTFCNLRLADHGQQYIPLITELLQKHFHYTDQQMHKQVHDYLQKCIAIDQLIKKESKA
ncbi:MAG: FAD-dependent oxidoreductase [Bdellovibrionota bacterium]